MHLHIHFDDPNDDLNDDLRERLDAGVSELLGAPVENDGLYELWESQSPTQTNLNYQQAMRIVNQAKGQEKK